MRTMAKWSEIGGAPRVRGLLRRHPCPECGKLMFRKKHVSDCDNRECEVSYCKFDHRGRATKIRRVAIANEV